MDVRMRLYFSRLLLLVFLVLVFLMATAQPVNPFVANVNSIDVKT